MRFQPLALFCLGFLFLSCSQKEYDNPFSHLRVNYLERHLVHIAIALDTDAALYSLNNIPLPLLSEEGRMSIIDQGNSFRNYRNEALKKSISALEDMDEDKLLQFSEDARSVFAMFSTSILTYLEEDASSSPLLHDDQVFQSFSRWMTMLNEEREKVSVLCKQTNVSAFYILANMNLMLHAGTPVKAMERFPKQAQMQGMTREETSVLLQGIMQAMHLEASVKLSFLKSISLEVLQSAPEIINMVDLHNTMITFNTYVADEAFIDPERFLRVWEPTSYFSKTVKELGDLYMAGTENFDSWMDDQLMILYDENNFLITPEWWPDGIR